MKKMSAIKEMVLWMTLIVMMLLAFVVIVDVCSIPVFVEHYDGYSIIHYFRLDWLEGLRSIVS